MRGCHSSGTGRITALGSSWPRSTRIVQRKYGVYLRLMLLCLVGVAVSLGPACPLGPPLGHLFLVVVFAAQICEAKEINL
jgi:hypothetical protein